MGFVIALALGAGALGSSVQPAGAATPPLPLGTDGQGVHLDAQERGKPPHRHRELVLTFDDSAAALFKRIAGRTLAVSCGHLSRRRTLFAFDASISTTLETPRRRKPIPLGFAGRYDLCRIGIHHGRHTTPLTQIPLTASGAERLDEDRTAKTVIAAVRLLDRPERPSAAAVAAQMHGVALASPAEAPPPGVLGVYSDGIAHVYAARTDIGGKLLFVEEEGDVTRTNVVDSLLGEDGLL